MTWRDVTWRTSVLLVAAVSLEALAVAAFASEAGAVAKQAVDDPAFFERLAEKFGWVAALVVVAFFVLLGLVVLVLRSLLKAQRRQEESLRSADTERRALEATREHRLVEGLMGLAKLQGETRDAVTRQTALMLATDRADPTRVDEILAQLNAADRLCNVCPLRDLPEPERAAVVERAKWCARNYQQCLVNPAAGK